ncbi:Serine/threonine-protein kinase rio2 [Galdieria sulphuraria]|nr:Serine/threonine-protein kinase rio2 [Galdieria sulphuraria]
MKLDACSLKSLSKMELRVLSAVEMVEAEWLSLTNLGYDVLALNTLLCRGSISQIGDKIGVGKESDVFLAQNEKGNKLVLKFQRLGRTSFRAVKEKRDYLKHRKSASWLYLSRLAAQIEYRCLKAFYKAELPVPKPIDANRHCICMQYIENSIQLSDATKLVNPFAVYEKCITMMEKLLKIGVVHGDFNQFNILLDEHENVFLIDFPQVISINHVDAEYYFEHDLSCLQDFFAKFDLDLCSVAQLSFQEIKKELDTSEHAKFLNLDEDVDENNSEDEGNEHMMQSSVNNVENYNDEAELDYDVEKDKCYSDIVKKVRDEWKVSESKTSRLRPNMKQSRKELSAYVS